jgi:uncharacterized protein with HEPN domain
LIVPPTLADRLHHVLHVIENIERFLNGKLQEDFANDQLLRLAVERSLEIVSEASRRIPAEVKARETQIEWQRMAELGNFLRHACHDLNPTTLWRIVESDLKPLKAFAERILREEHG